jgi:hypothetical protein
MFAILLGLLLSAGLLVAGLSAPPATAAQSAGGPPLRPGYRSEREGAVKWTYPSAALAEIRDLQTDAREIWARLGTELGVYLEPELDIRVAVNPEQMAALAPAGRTVPPYASGVAFPPEGVVLLTLTAPESWVRPDMPKLLAHELSHVALHRALDGHSIPRWFAEGVAIHHSGEHSFARIRTLWAATLRGGLVGLRDLSERFPEQHGEVDVAYAESADLVGFMLEGQAGPHRFRALCAGLQSGVPFEGAFAAAYQMTLPELEQQWRTQLGQRFGRWPSILSGLTVVWALAALLLVFGYLQVRRKHRRTLERWALEEAPAALPQPQAAVAAPPPPPLPRSVADAVLDAWGDQQRHEGGIPTIVHEGRSYTLH